VCRHCRKKLFGLSCIGRLVFTWFLSMAILLAVLFPSVVRTPHGLLFYAAIIIASIAVVRIGDTPPD
jgi:hypothetical protein